MNTQPLLLVDLTKLVRGRRTRWLSLHVIGNLRLLELALENHKATTEVQTLFRQLLVE